MKKKILVLGMAIILLFSVVAFGTAACRFYDPSRTELLARLAEFEERLDALEKENRILSGQVALWEYRADAIRELREFADARGEWNFRLANWNIIQSYIVGATTAIIAAENNATIEYVVEKTKGYIRAIRLITEEFLLTISVEETTVPQGENFIIYVELKNQSGEDVEIVFDDLFGIYAPELVRETVHANGAIQRLFLNNSIIQGEFIIGAGTPSGTYEVRAFAWFGWILDKCCASFAPPEWVYYTVEIWSDKILLTVQ